MSPNANDLETLFNEKLEEILTEEVPENLQQNDLKDEKSYNEINDKNLIKNVNNKVLLDTLSPEISKNEKTKRIHKYILIALLALFLLGQFLVVFNLSVNSLNYATSNNANIDMANSLFTFVSAYITSVVIELIAILNYIVHNVFDSSITDLARIFKETDNSKKGQDN